MANAYIFSQFEQKNSQSEGHFFVNQYSLQIAFIFNGLLIKIKHMIRNKSESMQLKRRCLRKYYKKWMKKFSQFRLKCRKKGPRAPSQKCWKNPCRQMIKFCHSHLTHNISNYCMRRFFFGLVQFYFLTKLMFCYDITTKSVTLLSDFCCNAF